MIEAVAMGLATTGFCRGEEPSRSAAPGGVNHSLGLTLMQNA